MSELNKGLLLCLRYYRLQCSPETVMMPCNYNWLPPRLWALDLRTSENKAKTLCLVLQLGQSTFDHWASFISLIWI